jgi:type II secretory pathway predicted ATPase ExeA
MNNEIMQFFGLNRPFYNVSFLETNIIKKQVDNIKHASHVGGIVALTGMVGTGKTTLLWQIQQQLRDEKTVVVCRSLSTDKKRVTISTLYMALFFDLVKDKNFKIPNQAEQRERKLLELVKKQDKPIVLFIDEAHDLSSRTLISLKRLVELVYSSGSILTVIMAGHPKLANDLSRPTMEEIGARTQIFQLNHWIENKENYVKWLFKQCCRKDIKLDDIMSVEAMELLVNSLVTPLQINHYLARALQQAYLSGTKPITTEIVEYTCTRFGWDTC